jgi:hypothetical protein
MFQIDPLGLIGLIPQSIKQQARDALVDFVTDQAKKYASDEIAAKLKKLRSDAAFNQAFEEGLQRAAQRFIAEYELQDEDLVAAIAVDKGFFENEEVQSALIAILKKPGASLAEERERETLLLRSDDRTTMIKLRPGEDKIIERNRLGRYIKSRIVDVNGFVVNADGYHYVSGVFIPIGQIARASENQTRYTRFQVGSHGG